MSADCVRISILPCTPQREVENVFGAITLNSVTLERDRLLIISELTTVSDRGVSTGFFKKPSASLGSFGRMLFGSRFVSEATNFSSVTIGSSVFFSRMASDCASSAAVLARKVAIRAKQQLGLRMMA